MIARRLCTVLAIFAIGAALGFRLGHRSPSPRSQPKGDAMLSPVISHVGLGSTTYGGAIEYLRAISGENIAVDWRNLADANIHPQTPVAMDLQLHDVTTYQLLDAFTRSAGTHDVRVIWGIHNGIIVLTAVGLESLPMADLPEVVTLDYDASDLISHDGSWEKLTLNRSNDPPPSEPLNVDQRSEALIFTLRELIDRDSWRDAGGLVGAAQIHWGRLVVTISRESQQAVAEVLKALREAR